MNKRQISLLGLLLLLSLLSFVGINPVQAHALLVRSIPDANASLARAPVQIELFFSEAVDANLSRISVLDSASNRVDTGDSRVDASDPTHVLVSLRSLPDGVYTVALNVVSAMDGHETSGSFPFAVGSDQSAALASAKKASTSSDVDAGDILTKGLYYLIAAALTGNILFTALVWNPSQQQIRLPSDGIISYGIFSRKYLLVSLVGLEVVDFLGVLVQTGHATGALVGMPWQPAFLSVLLQSRIGVLAIARLGLAFLLAALLLPNPNRWNRWIGVGACTLLLLSLSLESHATSDRQPVLPVLADWIHLMGVSIWVGGLFSFLGGLRAVRELPDEMRTRFTSILIPRFSTLALISVCTLTITGVYSAVLRIGTLDALWDTTYGQVLLVKLFVVLILLGLGGANLLFTTPRMRRAAQAAGGSPREVARFQMLLAGEVILAGALLIWVGVFTSLPPAKVAAPPLGFGGMQQADDLMVMFKIDPNRVGINTFTAIIEQGTKPLNDAQKVALEFTAYSGRVPPSKVTLIGQGNGVYSVQGGFLGTRDTWKIQVVVTRAGKYDAYAPFVVDLTAIPGAPAAGPSLLPVAIGLLVATGICYLAAFKMVDRRTRRQLGLDVIPVVAGIITAMILTIGPLVAPPVDPINPITLNAASIEAGGALYQQYCQVCHGTSGKGDGPMGLTLVPRPADLSQHAIPGVHTDGKLFQWITDGIPGSVMPAFAGKLSVTDRWNLVNFIRTLAPK